jgi:hypothetical protein
MEFMTIHTMGSTMTQETMVASLEMGKKLMAKPGDFVPGGKLLFSYAGRGKGIIVCLWEAPNVDCMMPALEQMHLLGWDTEIIPVDEMNIHLKKLEQAMKARK